jgi:hypothetical protein
MDTKTLVRGDLAAVWDGDDIVVLNRDMERLIRYTVDYLEKCEMGYLDGRFGKVPTHLEMALNLSERAANDWVLWDKSPDFDRIMCRDPFQVTAKSCG